MVALHKLVEQPRPADVARRSWTQPKSRCYVQCWQGTVTGPAHALLAGMVQLVINPPVVPTTHTGAVNEDPQIAPPVLSTQTVYGQKPPQTRRVPATWHPSAFPAAVHDPAPPPPSVQDVKTVQTVQGADGVARQHAPAAEDDSILAASGVNPFPPSRNTPPASTIAPAISISRHL